VRFFDRRSLGETCFVAALRAQGSAVLTGQSSRRAGKTTLPYAFVTSHSHALCKASVKQRG
jgi:hypothetical protein